MKKNYPMVSIFIFLFSFGSILIFIIFDIFFYSYNLKDKLMNNAISILEEKDSYFVRSINNTQEVLIALRESENFKNYLNDENVNKNSLKDVFLLLARHDENIMQIRYIDSRGIEEVRVDRNNSENIPKIIDSNQLQDKSSRYYFQESLTKPLEKVWYSNLDLNVEYEKVESPYNPTIRAILPISRENKLDGILIINYAMNLILKDVSNIPYYNLVIINDLGHILTHYQNEKSWSFYKEDKNNAGNQIKGFNDNTYSKDIFINDNYISKKVTLDLPNKLFFILNLDEKEFNALLKDNVNQYLIIGGILTFISILMSILFSNYLKRIFATLEDSETKNKNLYNEVKQINKELHNSKQQYENIINSLNDFVWETDINNKYTYISKQIKNILGYEINEILGKTPFDFLNEKESDKLIKYFTTNERNEQQVITQYIHKNGTIVFIELSSSQVFNEENKLIGYRGISRDITQKINAKKIIEESYEKIKELNEELALKIYDEVEKNHNKDLQLFSQSKMAAMGDMLANISHQWRQPLSTISTIASGIKLQNDYGQLDLELISKNMDIIVQKTNHLSETIDIFMNYLKK